MNIVALSDARGGSRKIHAWLIFKIIFTPQSNLQSLEFTGGVRRTRTADLFDVNEAKTTNKKAYKFSNYKASRLAVARFHINYNTSENQPFKAF